MTKENQTKKLVSLAQEASTLISAEIKKQAKRRALGNHFNKLGKGGDLSKFGDLLAEKIIIKYLSSLIKKKNFDKIILVSEESGIKEFLKKGKNKEKNSIFIILDPIDGSNNMRPWRTPRSFVGISLAIGHLNRIDDYSNLSAVEVGWIRDIFYDLDYYAILNGGAYFIDSNSKKITTLKIGSPIDLFESTIAASLDSRGKKFDEIINRLKPILKNSKCQRRLGSTVLDLSKVACGEFDAFISLSGNIKIHDIAAAKLIIEEAGGIFYFNQIKGPKINYLKKLINYKQDNFIKDIGFEVIAASGKKLFDEIKKLLK